MARMLTIVSFLTLVLVAPGERSGFTGGVDMAASSARISAELGG